MCVRRGEEWSAQTWFESTQKWFFTLIKRWFDVHDRLHSIVPCGLNLFGVCRRSTSHSSWMVIKHPKNMISHFWENNYLLSYFCISMSIAVNELQVEKLPSLSSPQLTNEYNIPRPKSKRSIQNSTSIRTKLILFSIFSHKGSEQDIHPWAGGFTQLRSRCSSGDTLQVSWSGDTKDVMIQFFTNERLKWYENKYWLENLVLR